MIATRIAADMHSRINHRAERLSDVERYTLAKAALVLGEVRVVTLEKEHWIRIMNILSEIAPSFADELGCLLRTVEEIHQHLSIPPSQEGKQ